MAPVVIDQGPVRCGTRASRRPRPRGHSVRPLPAALCFALTRSLLLTCLVPAGLLALRYYYSRKVVLAYLDCALHTDMADIEQYYMKPPGEALGPAPTPQPFLPAELPGPSSLRWARGSLGWMGCELSLPGTRALASGGVLQAGRAGLAGLGPPGASLASVLCPLRAGCCWPKLALGHADPPYGSGCRCRSPGAHLTPQGPIRCVSWVPGWPGMLVP